jgi:predicted metal-dependent phosphoesterase TrpH
MVDRMARDLPITWDQVVAQAAPGATIGRPHIADALVAAAAVPDRRAAFAKVLSAQGPYYEPHYATPTTQMIHLIRQAGGVSVLAHPGAVGRGRVVGDPAIREMAAAGLGGLEAYHRDNPPDQRERLVRLAGELGLVITGSSDYHGSGKPNRLGENLTDPLVLDWIVAQSGGVALV